MTKEEEFKKIAEQLDVIECQSFALWYLLPEFSKICAKEIAKICANNDIASHAAQMKFWELIKAAEEMRDLIADELW